MKKSFIIFGLFVFTLLSCDNPASVDPPATEDQYAPLISCMKLGFDDRTSAKFPSLPNTSVFYNVHIYLKNSSRYDEIDKICIKTPTGKTWSREKADLSWNEARERFDFYNLYCMTQDDYATLGEYTITVSQAGKLDSVFVFKAYNNNDPQQNSGDVYSLTSQVAPKFVSKPSNLLAKKSSDGKSLIVTADSIDSRYYGLFIWLYDNDGEYIEGYDLAWPFEESQYNNMQLTKTLTADQASKTKNVIVGIIAEKKLPEVATTIMMYRYLHRFDL